MNTQNSYPMPQVWDPGSRTEIYQNNIKIQRVPHNRLDRAKQTKDIKTSKIEHPKQIYSHRPSPNKSQDSGFSDSGDSETSSSIVSSDNKPHITRVYFYSSSNISNNTSENHYSSPSSLPVFSGKRMLEKVPRNDRKSKSVQNIAGRKEKKKQAPFSNIEQESHSWSKQLSVSSSFKFPSSTYVDKSGDCIYNGEQITRKCTDVLKTAYNSSFSTKKLQRSPYEVNELTSDEEEISAEENTKDNRMNSIQVLLDEFRKEDSSYCNDTHARTFLLNASPEETTSSISLHSSISLSELSDHSSVLSGTSNFQPLTRNPIDHWLSELPSLHESECSVMLQSKSLFGQTDTKCKSLKDIRSIQEQARQVSNCFADLCRILSVQTPKEKLVTSIQFLESEVQKLTISAKESQLSNVITKELLSLPGLKLKTSSCKFKKEAQKYNSLEKEHLNLLNLLHNLKVCSTMERKGNLARMVEIVTQFGSCLTVLVELMLSTKVQVIVSSLKQPNSESELETSLVNLTSLGLEGNHLCRLVARYEGVSWLVKLLSNKKFISLRVAILRALGTVCSVLEAIRQLEEVKGVEVIATMLGDKGTSEMEKAEAAGVLAQVTSPWIEENDYVLGVTENAFYLVKELTEMCRSTKCAETFLLSSAALANLSFLSPLILTAMSQMDTVSVLLSFLSHNVSPSIYIQDQVATVLANMAARQDTRDLLLNCDLVHVLLYLLAASPTNSQLPVMAATQRVQQKAAIAIARLSSSPSVVSGVLSGSGLDRLVELSVCKKARLDSDSTLVAVITAVRRF